MRTSESTWNFAIFHHRLRFFARAPIFFASHLSFPIVPIAEAEKFYKYFILRFDDRNDLNQWCRAEKKGGEKKKYHDRHPKPLS
jgi:hypothetical protein